MPSCIFKFCIHCQSTLGLIISICPNSVYPLSHLHHIFIQKKIWEARITFMASCPAVGTATRQDKTIFLPHQALKWQIPKFSQEETSTAFYAEFNNSKNKAYFLDKGHKSSSVLLFSLWSRPKHNLVFDEAILRSLHTWKQKLAGQLFLKTKQNKPHVQQGCLFQRSRLTINTRTYSLNVGSLAKNAIFNRSICNVMH